MKLLAVDTATEICGIALAENGRVTAELILDRGETHTRSIMEAVQANGKYKLNEVRAKAPDLNPAAFISAALLLKKEGKLRS